MPDIVYIAYKIDVEGARMRLLIKLCKKKLQKKFYVADSIGEKKILPSKHSISILEMDSEGIFHAPFFWIYFHPSTLWAASPLRPNTFWLQHISAHTWL